MATINANIAYSTHKNLYPNAFSTHNNTQTLGCGPWDQVSSKHNSSLILEFSIMKGTHVVYYKLLNKQSLTINFFFNNHNL